MILTIIMIQLFAVLISTHLLLVERKYCKNCDWWNDVGAIVFFLSSLIPIVGIFISIGSCADYARNIINELNRRLKE